MHAVCIGIVHLVMHIMQISWYITTMTVILSATSSDQLESIYSALKYLFFILYEIDQKKNLIFLLFKGRLAAQFTLF